MPRKERRETAARRVKHAQSALEYLTTYGWAILIIAVIVAILYLYISAPSQIATNSCNFVNGAYCNDLILATNTVSHTTIAAFFLTNSQPYPINDPVLYAQVDSKNSSAFQCSPTFVLAGGSMICNVILPVNTLLDAFLAGTLYLNATYCGLSPQYKNKQSCSSGVPQTYTGQFSGHTQPLISTKSTLSLTAVNYTQTANSNPDPLTATVDLLGYPLRGATVSFTENLLYYPLNPNLTTSNSAGTALSSISGTKPGSVLVTVTYAGLSNSIIVNFAAAVMVTYQLADFTSCASGGSTAFIDSVSYTCSQLQGKAFGYTKGTTHSYQFLSNVLAGTGTRDSFISVTVQGIPSKSASGSIVANANMTIPATYYVQYQLSESASPPNGGTVDPGPGWYNSSNAVVISETPDPPYIFTGWTCSGSGCYSGSSTSTTVTMMNNPITETAGYVSTSTTSTSSTSTSSTSTSSTSTSPTTTSSSTSTSSTSTGTTTSSTTSSTTSTSTSTTSTSSSTSSTTSSSTSTSTSSTSSSTTTSTSTSTTTIQYYTLTLQAGGVSGGGCGRPGTGLGPCGLDYSNDPNFGSYCQVAGPISGNTIVVGSTTATLPAGISIDAATYAVNCCFSGQYSSGYLDVYYTDNGVLYTQGVVNRGGRAIGFPLIANMIVTTDGLSCA